MALKINLAGAAKPSLPAARVIPKDTAQFEQIVKDETQEADRIIAEADKVIDRTPQSTAVTESTEENISDANDKLSRLVDDDFPFDDTQLTAIYGLVQQQYGVMIGAAGTGKTTTTKKLVDMLRDGLEEIDVSKYWIRGVVNDDDDYEIPEKLIPSIAMVSFTGRATQMIKKNFPRDWHGNIMTIHRALGFIPEYYQDFDEESGQMVNKRRFVPTYTAENQMPWDIIIVDEAGMLGLDLWHQLWAATKDTCRIILIGDINQLPPTHGKSILGFALAKWPTWELTHVHRQQGENNSIVDNAHRILKGLRPVSDSPTALTIAKTDKEMLQALNYMVKDDSWRFITIEVPEEHKLASIRIRQTLALLQGKIYEPNRDVLITPINGHEQTAPGYSLGQEPLNQELVVKLNSKNPRYLIDAGREKQNFAVGDKVMATVNDYEAGITNGMTGIIKTIQPNGAYIGDTHRWGLITEVNEYLSGLVTEEDDDVEFSLEEMASDSEAGLEEMRKKEKRDAGPASHIVEVEFGEGEHAFQINFATKSAVASLMLAYAATCHKMQGGECPLVFGIVHQANKRPLNREWFYTMVTRASQRCVVFTTRQGLGFALGKQNIKGATLKAKIQTFIELTKSGIAGPTVRVKIPAPRDLQGNVTHYNPQENKYAEDEKAIPAGSCSAGQELAPAISQPIDSRTALTAAPIQQGHEQASQTIIRERNVAPSIRIGTLNIYVRNESKHVHIQQTTGGQSSDGHGINSEHGGPPEGDTVVLESPRGINFSKLSRTRSWNEVIQQEIVDPKGSLHLPRLAAPRFVSTLGAVKMLHKLEDAQAVKLLTHQPLTKKQEYAKAYGMGAVKVHAMTQKKPLSIGQLLMKRKAL